MNAPSSAVTLVTPAISNLCVYRPMRPTITALPDTSFTVLQLFPAALTEDAAAFVTAPAGPAVDGAVTVVDLDEPLLVPVEGLWQPHTTSAVHDAIVR